ncbi:hypothetical protein E2320_000284 [Naja naja]|nr:hypothetical protein E2320_000284 [Naja naja]
MSTAENLPTPSPVSFSAAEGGPACATRCQTAFSFAAQQQQQQQLTLFWRGDDTCALFFFPVFLCCTSVSKKAGAEVDGGGGCKWLLVCGFPPVFFLFVVYYFFSSSDEIFFHLGRKEERNCTQRQAELDCPVRLWEASPARNKIAKLIAAFWFAPFYFEISTPPSWTTGVG